MEDWEEGKEEDLNKPLDGQIAYDELLGELGAEKQSEQDTSAPLIEGQLDVFSFLHDTDNTKVYVPKRTEKVKIKIEKENNNLAKQLTETNERRVIQKIMDYDEEITDERNIETNKQNGENMQEEKIRFTGSGGDNGSGVITRSLDEVLHTSMIPYTEHVVMDRALPRVEDGLKPVQRRILFSMMELNLFPDKPYRKSARIVGDCMGKYHPHGDSSVYDAMVRMSQDFSLRAPLVDGHGNFGSMDGDSAAAMRYTEARMTPLALELLRDLDKDTVKWSYNFDDTLKEPDMLPGRFPNLLVNGASGIAVGLATNIPPHNLAEVIDGVCAYIDNPKITLKDMMKIIKAPDFPTGGYIIPNELEQAYSTGKGKITIRAKAFIEKSGDKENIIITELPYQTNKASLLQKIAELKEHNKDKLAAISEIRDESDRSGLRCVIRIKKDGNAKAILSYLFKATGLEVSFGINMVAIAGGKPKLMGLMDIISYYTDYQREIIVRRTKYDLNAAKERAHIVEGLLIAIKNIDEVIKIIKKSATASEAKSKLRERFNLSERQAQAILDMRLARLVNLEVTKLEQELKELKQKIKDLEAILNSKKLQFDVVKKELNDIKRSYKNERRSALLKSSDIKIEEVDESKIFEKEIIIGITAGRGIKAIPTKNYSMAVKEITDTSSLNDIHVQLYSVKTTDNILIFTNLGNCIKVSASKIPEAKWRDKGFELRAIDKNAGISEYPVSIIPVTEENINVVLCTKNGMAKKTSLKDLIVSKTYYQVIKLNEKDCVIMAEPEKQGRGILMLTNNGMSLNFDQSEIPIQGRVSGGVRGINLDEKDKVIFAGFNEGNKVVAATDNGYIKSIDLKEFPLSARYRKGQKYINLKNSKVIFASIDAKSIAFDMGLKIEEVKEKQIPVSGRLTEGKQVVKKKLLGIYEYKR